MAIQIESERLLALERNRIAEELHDRVSQHLFGVVYAAQSMIGEWSDMAEERKLEQLKEIRDAAATASCELRATIYNQCLRQNATTSWIETVQSHLTNQARLSGVHIRFHAPESDRRLSINHRKALHRIILEAVGNAIRHGASSSVTVSMIVKRAFVKLTIADNGKGFDAGSRLSGKKAGLGLGNMSKLAASLGGTFDIDSREGRGTRLRVLLPLADMADSIGQNTKSG